MLFSKQTTVFNFFFLNVSDVIFKIILNFFLIIYIIINNDLFNSSVKCSIYNLRCFITSAYLSYL